MLTCDRLREFLLYDAESGKFTRLKGRGKNAGAPKPGKNGYISYGIDRKAYLAHRLVWLYVHGEWPKELIDHVNGKRDDNRIANLRECDKSGNMANSKGNGAASGMKGVYRHGNGWRSRIGVRGEDICLGTFRTADEAQQAYCAAATKHFAEFARPS